MSTLYDSQYSNRTLYGIQSNAIRYSWAGYMFFVLTSSLLGDTTILIASVRFRAFKLHRVIIAIIQHLAVCDLMVSVTDVLPNLVSIMSNKWVLGNLLCYLAPYPKYYFLLTSVFLICTMTLSKLLLLKYPLRFGTTTLMTAHLICGACWAIALIAPGVQIFVDSHDIYFSYRNYQCAYGFSSEIWNWLMPMLSVFFMFIPNAVVVTCTICLLSIAKGFARRSRRSLKWQGITTTVITATVYCLSFLPYCVYRVGNSIITVDDESKSFFHTSFYRVSLSFLNLNTISNFYIYSLTVNSFRNFIRSSLRLTYRSFTSTGTSDSQGEKKIFK